MYSFGVVALEIATGRRSDYRMKNDSEVGLESLWERRSFFGSGWEDA